MLARLPTQIIAIATVSVYLLLVLILTLFVLHNLLFSILFGLTVMIAIYGLWLLFSGVGKRLRYGALFVGIGLILLTFEILFLFKNITNAVALLVVFALIASYIMLINYLRDRFWHERRANAQQTSSGVSFFKPYLIINPKSGNGRAIKAHIDKLAAEHGITVHVTRKSDNIELLARQAVNNGADVLGVSGGDGTLGAVAKVAIENDVPLVVLPGGTRCHFARDIGLEPGKIVDALAGFNGVKRKVDVGIINGRVFLNNASFGIYAEVVDQDEYREHKVATTRKVLQELLDGERDKYSLRFEDNRGNRYQTAVQLLVGVNPYQVLNILELGHRDQLDGGKLQITALTNLDDATIRRLVSGLTFKRDLNAYDSLIQWNCTDFIIRSTSKQLVAGVDGERETYKTPVKINILPKKLTLMVPPEGNRPRKKSPFSRVITRELWRMATNSRR
jgi:diacylglycerol kinase family enzyme